MSQIFKDDASKLETAEFSERFRMAMEKVGGFSALSRAAGISQASITNYLKGQKPKIDVAIKVANSCGVDPAWLILGGAAKHGDTEPLSYPASAPDPLQTDTVQIPLVNIEASAGAGLIPSEWEQAEMIPFSRDLAHRILGALSKHIFMMRVRGDSMMPTIHPKDTLFVDYAPCRISPGIYVLVAGEMTLVKRLAAKNPWTYSVISDNSLYPTFDVPMEKACWGNADPEADVRIIGRVVSVIHEFD